MENLLPSYELVPPAGQRLGLIREERGKRQNEQGFCEPRLELFFQPSFLAIVPTGADLISSFLQELI